MVSPRPKDSCDTCVRIGMRLRSGESVARFAAQHRTDMAIAVVGDEVQALFTRTTRFAQKKFRRHGHFSVSMCISDNRESFFEVKELAA
jgi:hypothetical protein